MLRNGGRLSRDGGRRPAGRRYGFLFISAFCSIVSGAGFQPLVLIFAQSMQCVDMDVVHLHALPDDVIAERKAAGLSTCGTVGRNFTNSTPPLGWRLAAEAGRVSGNIGPECWTRWHVGPYVVPAWISFVALVPLVVRFARVRRQLNRIVANDCGEKLWDYSSDDHELHPEYMHPLSLRSSWYELFMLPSKVLIVLSGMFLSRVSPTLCQLVILCVGSFMCGLGYAHPPYFNRWANLARVGIDVGVVWIYIAGASAAGSYELVGCDALEQSPLQSTLPGLFPLAILAFVAVQLWKERHHLETQWGLAIPHHHDRGDVFCCCCC